MGRTPAGETRRKIYRFVREQLLLGESPSVREVQQAFGFRAVQSAQEHLQALVRDGLLEKTTGRSRGFRLPAGAVPGLPLRQVPLLGRVQAGSLTTALEDAEGFLAIESRFAAEELFALRVQGQSMTGVGILPGDIVLVRKQATADSGDTVVALVGDEATVKTLRRKGRRIELHPENPDFDVIIPAADSLELLGKVVEVRRYLDGSPLQTAAQE